MKKYYRNFITGTNWALAGIMAILGFSACDDTDDDKGLVVEYGTPHANYAVKGRVTDLEGNALSGIQVVIPEVNHCQRTTQGFIPDHPVITQQRGDTLYTSYNGEFEYKYGGFPTDTVRINIKFEDILTEPRFISDSTSVSFLLKDLNNGERWYAGYAEKHIDIKLVDKN